MKLKFLLLSTFFSFVIPKIIFAQEHKFTAYIGPKLRVTNIYTNINTLLGVVFTPISDILAPGDSYYSGLGLQAMEKYSINKYWQVRFHQTIRYDILHYRLALPYDSATLFGPIINLGAKKRFIIDTYFDIAYKIKRPKNNYYVTVGYAACGFNTKHTETFRFFTTPTNYYDKVTENDFFFPAVTASFAWEKKKFCSELKFGYCWRNPTWWKDAKFIFLELSIQYKIF